MRLRDLLVGNLGVVVNGRSLGDQGEPVEEGVEEANDGEADCYISDGARVTPRLDLHMAQERPSMAVTRRHQWKSGRQLTGMRSSELLHCRP